MGSYDFSAGDGGYTPGGLYTKIFIMYFNAQNAFPGLFEVRNGGLTKKKFFCSQKMGENTPCGYTSGITVGMNRQYST